MIFYFSGTGNTKWAAETIAQSTNERLIAIADEINTDCHYSLEEGERIGFCFPVHGWQPPHIVRMFISKLSFNNYNDNYTYALCTCGDTVGHTMRILAKDLSNKNMILSSCFSIIMPESYVCLPFMYTDTEEKEASKINNARNIIKTISEDIVNYRKGIERLVKGATPWLYSYVIGNYFNKRMVTDKPFNVNNSECIGCGLCEKVCPTKNIIIQDNKPTWKHNGDCTCCLACYHHCPKHAINYGKITRKRGQYYFKENII